MTSPAAEQHADPEPDKEDMRCGICDRTPMTANCPHACGGSA